MDEVVISVVSTNMETDLDNGMAEAVLALREIVVVADLAFAKAIGLGCKQQYNHRSKLPITLFTPALDRLNGEIIEKLCVAGTCETWFIKRLDCRLVETAVEIYVSKSIPSVYLSGQYILFLGVSLPDNPCNTAGFA